MNRSGNQVVVETDSADNPSNKTRKFSQAGSLNTMASDAEQTAVRVRATPPTTPEPSPQVRGPGGMGTAGWRVGTLNFGGFKRVRGGLKMGCAQIRRLMADSNLDVLVVTEHNMGGGYDSDQVLRLLKRDELKCVVAGGKSPGESHGTGVMLVWRDEEGGHRRLHSNNHTTFDDGRVVSAEFTNPTAGRKASVSIIGVYGVSGANRTEEAKHVWKTVGWRIRDFHRYHLDGGVLMTGDFNAHARSQDGPRMNLPVSTEFATMLVTRWLVDTAEVTGNVDLRPSHKPRNGDTKQGDVNGNRLDRAYVSGVALMAAVCNEEHAGSGGSTSPVRDGGGAIQQGRHSDTHDRRTLLHEESAGTADKHTHGTAVQPGKRFRSGPLGNTGRVPRKAGEITRPNIERHRQDREVDRGIGEMAPRARDKGGLVVEYGTGGQKTNNGVGNGHGNRWGRKP